MAKPVTKAFLSTPSARRATGFRADRQHFQNISIHALREEGDLLSYLKESELEEFLSTPSARRATRKPEQGHCQRQDFYPRPPRGGRHGYIQGIKNGKKFLSTPSARRAT